MTAQFQTRAQAMRAVKDCLAPVLAPYGFRTFASGFYRGLGPLMQVVAVSGPFRKATGMLDAEITFSVICPEWNRRWGDSEVPLDPKEFECYENPVYEPVSTMGPDATFKDWWEEGVIGVSTPEQAKAKCPRWHRAVTELVLPWVERLTSIEELAEIYIEYGKGRSVPVLRSKSQVHKVYKSLVLTGKLDQEAEPFLTWLHMNYVRNPVNLIWEPKEPGSG